MELSRIIERIKEKFGIAELNEMQLHATEVAETGRDVVLYSPTGTGKTLAYAISVLERIDASVKDVQAVVLVPSRELAQQVGEVFRVLAEGFRVLACYGGHKVSTEYNSLEGRPAVIIATPGRMADVLKRGFVRTSFCHTLVIDEVDKMVELGFQPDVSAVISKLRNVEHRFLTSATCADELPAYLHMSFAQVLDYTANKSDVDSRLEIRKIDCGAGDKDEALRQLLLALPEGRTIVFVNQRERVPDVVARLRRAGITTGGYHGELEQIKREKVVAMFENGTLPVLVATDLAARGLDIDGVENVVHYDLPLTEEIFTHRNGRTARVTATGRVFVLVDDGEDCPVFVKGEPYWLPPVPARDTLGSDVATLYVNEGRKDKLSRADILGWIVNSGAVIYSGEVGKIVLHDHYTLVAVPRTKVTELLRVLNTVKVKGRRVRVSEAKAGERM